jgi:hypothetical protein
MIFIQILNRRLQKGRKVLRTPSPKAKQSKYSQIVLTQQLSSNGYQAGKGFSNSKVGTLVQGPKSRENIPNQRLQTAESKRDFSGKVAFWKKDLFSIFNVLAYNRPPGT